MVKDLVDLMKGENWVCPECGGYEDERMTTYEDPDDAPRGIGLMVCAMCGAYIDCGR
jgi:hypothetical protein